MIHLLHQNGNIEHYLDFQHINRHTIALYDTSNINEGNYIVSPINIPEMEIDKEKMLPAIYDSDAYGPLTNESFDKYGISVMILATSKNVEDIKDIAQNLINNKIKIGDN